MYMCIYKYTSIYVYIYTPPAAVVAAQQHSSASTVAHTQIYTNINSCRSMYIYIVVYLCIYIYIIYTYFSFIHIYVYNVTCFECKSLSIYI